MTDENAEYFIGMIDVLHAGMIALVESGFLTYEKVISLADDIIEQQAAQDNGTRPSRHTAAQVLRASAVAMSQGETVPTPSRPSLRVILGGVNDQVEGREGS